MLLTPSALRPHQYRFDLALLAPEWKQHFWNPAYDAAVLKRKPMALLFRVLQSAVEAEFGAGPETDLLSEANEEVDSAAEIADALAMPVEGSGTDAEQEPGGLPEPMPRRSGEGGDLTPM